MIQDYHLEILYEDNHICVVNKDACVPVQPDSSGDPSLFELLKSDLKERYQKKGEVYLGLPHRLDRPVSGAVLFAKTSKSMSRLSEAIRSRQIEKTYWAITAALPSREYGELCHFLVKDSKKNKSFPVSPSAKGAKEARLNYRLIRATDRYFLVEIKLITGRHHQIRTQLAAVGMPIRGDLKYGARRSNSDGSISLHARSLELIHPVKKTPIKIIANPPQDNLWRIFCT